MVGAIERDDRRLVVDHGFEVYRPGPQLVEVSQSILGIVLLEFNPLKSVLQIQFTAIAVIGIDHIDEGSTVIRQAIQELLLHLLELPRSDFVIVAAVIASICPEEDVNADTDHSRSRRGTSERRPPRALDGSRGPRDPA